MLNRLGDFSKTVVRTAIEMAYDEKPLPFVNRSDRTDPVFKSYPMDVLRRAAYRNDFDILFSQKDSHPYINPDKTLYKVIKKLSSNVFPKGTAFVSRNEALKEVLERLVSETKFQLKTEKIVKECALMGYCGLRSVYNQELNRWLLEVIPKEYLTIETMDGVNDEIIAISQAWPIVRVIDNKERLFWKKERWTKEIYQVWPEKEEKAGRKPKFEESEAEVSENTYKEIAITLCYHYCDDIAFGAGIVAEDEILNVKSLIRLKHKVHFAHLKYLTQNPVRINHANPSEPLDLGIGAVIDLQAADSERPVDLKLLQFDGIPDSANDEIYNHAKELYEAAELKPPSKDEIIRPGNDASGKALQILNVDDAKTIEKLRDNGYSMIQRHFEKILRMGKNINLFKDNNINVEDYETYEITVQFPEFFPPTDDEIAVKLANMQMAGLPPKIQAPIIASLFGIEDKDQIALIESNLEDKEAMAEPGNLDASSDGGSQV